MAYGIVLVFEGVGADGYWAVNDHLGIARDGTGDWPDGLLVHSATTLPSGMAVQEIWESKAAQERFMADRLGAALGQVGVPAPVQVIDGETINHQVPG